MRIGFLLDDTLDKPDGVQQYVLTLGRYFAAQGHEVHYLVAQTEWTDLANVHSLTRYSNFKFNQNNVRTPHPARMDEIRLLLGELDLDVLHVQVPYSPLLAGKVIRAASPKTRVIGTFHIMPATRLHAYANYLLRASINISIKRFHTIVAVSEAAAAFARKSYRIKCPIVPNCVDIQRFASKEPLKKSGVKKRVVFLGRFVERKGPQLLVGAIRELVAIYDVNNLEVVMGGTGPEFESVKGLTRAMGLHKTISFPGFIKEADKPQLLQSADIAVFPSLGAESFGIVLIEAMAAGAGVVIGGDNPGYRSVLGAKPELLLNPRDSKAFAITLRHLLISPEAKKIHLWQQRLVKQYDVKIVARRLHHIYTS